MKFARLLRTTAEDLPELQCLFHIYKHLKKQLKQLPARSDCKAPAGADLHPQAGRDHEEVAAAGAGGDGSAGQAHPEAGEEARFTAVLTDHLQRLNDRFLEREETCVIQLERLEAEAAQCAVAARAAAAAAAEAGSREGAGGNGDAHAEAGGASAALKAIAEQRAQLYKRFVNFHGEVLLLVHWSVLAYTATVKILKKHHKRTGLLLRAPQLADLLSQPFCSSELMTGLARKAEACIQRLAEQLASSATSGGGAATTTGGGGVTEDAAAAGGGGGPQDTVDQMLPAAGGAAAAATAAVMAKSAAAAAAAAAAAVAAANGSYGVADGSSPSCSQSLGEPVLRRLWGAGGAAVDAQAAEAEADAMEVGDEPRQPSTALLSPQEPDLASPPLPQRRRRQQEQQLLEQQLQGQGEAAGAPGGGGGRGATFLRNLARLSDNTSAASLSGPNVLEQLVELQQYVDEYDKMDEDDAEGRDVADEDDDEDEGEEDSGALTVGQGQGAAAAAAAAAARPAERDRAGGTAATAMTGAGDDTAPAAGGGISNRQPQPTAPPGAADLPSTSAGAGVGGLALMTGHVDPHPPRSQPPARLGTPDALGPAGQGENTGATARSGPGSGSGSGSGQGSAPVAPKAGGGADAAAAAMAAPHAAGAGAAAAVPLPPQQYLPQSSSGSAGAGGAAGSVSVAISEAFAAARPQGAAANLLRRTQVALTMWEQLRTNASTPSTVIDPAGGQTGQCSQGGGVGGGPRSKRRRTMESGAGGAAAAGGGGAADAAAADARQAAAEEPEESVADDSGSNSD